jgi:hypothetical protein
MGGHTENYRVKTGGILYTVESEIRQKIKAKESI